MVASTLNCIETFQASKLIDQTDIKDKLRLPKKSRYRIETIEIQNMILDFETWFV